MTPSSQSQMWVMRQLSFLLRKPWPGSVSFLPVGAPTWDMPRPLTPTTATRSWSPPSFLAAAFSSAAPSGPSREDCASAAAASAESLRKSRRFKKNMERVSLWHGARQGESGGNNRFIECKRATPDGQRINAEDLSFRARPPSTIRWQPQRVRQIRRRLPVAPRLVAEHLEEQKRQRQVD